MNFIEGQDPGMGIAHIMVFVLNILQLRGMWEIYINSLPHALLCPRVHAGFLLAISV